MGITNWWGMFFVATMAVAVVGMLVHASIMEKKIINKLSGNVKIKG